MKIEDPLIMLCDKQNAIKMAKKLGVHRKDKTY
jgi:hypothetical protein